MLEHSDMIEMEEVDFAVVARSISLANIHTGFFCMGDVADHPVYVDNDDQEVGNPRDGAIIYIKDNVAQISLLTMLDKNIMVERRGNGRPWTAFEIYGLKIESNRFASVLEPRGRFTLQTYNISLQKEASWGFMQFRCTAGEAAYDKETYLYGRLLTFFFFRDAQAYARSADVPLLTVRPIRDAMYVPLLPKQRMQLIVPSDTKIDQSTNLRLLYSVEHLNIGSTSYHYIRPSTQKLTDVDVMLLSRGKSRSSIIIPRLERQNGDLMQMVHPGQGTAAFCCQGTAGIVLNGVSKEPWIGRPSEISIKRSVDHEKIVFTKPQKYITVDKKGGYKWFVDCTETVLRVIGR